MLKYLIYLLFISVSTACSAQNTVDSCNKFNMGFSEKIEAVRNEFLKGNVVALKQRIKFPIRGQVFGSISSIYSETLDWDWQDLVSQNVILQIRNATHCDLTKYLGLKYVSGDFAITQMIFNSDENDLKYSSSGISSYNTFVEFIDNVNSLVLIKYLDSLAPLFKYPFHASNGVLISSKTDFHKNHRNIVDDFFIKLFVKAKTETNLHPRVTGIMLNQQGDIWVQQFNGMLKVVVLNKPIASL